MMEIDMNPYLWIGVGYPGVGKSVWIKKNCEIRSTQQIVVLGTDYLIDAHALRIGKTYNQVFKDYIDEATSLFFAQVQTAFAANWNVFIDRTNLTVKGRHKLLSLAPKHYKKLAIVFTCDKEVHDVRLQMRPGKTIPRGVLKSMEESFVYPTVEEGFDAVQEIVTG
jgi:tRNA uridine 5-carbamoylmethylation protein Kti12